MNNLQRQVCKPQTCLHIYLFELQGWCMTLTQMKYITLHDRHQKWIGRQQDAWSVTFFIFLLRRSDKIDHTDWINLVISHEQRAPVATQRSWSLCQYSYCAERSFARRAAEPTRQVLLIWIRSFKNLQLCQSPGCRPCNEWIAFLLGSCGSQPWHSPTFTRFLLCTTLSWSTPETWHL